MRLIGSRSALSSTLGNACAPKDVMVLCRKRESLRLAADALQARHVPHVAADELVLNEATEALDLVAVLDAIVSPRHRLSLARALRCPLFGAGDDDLIALRTHAGAHGDFDDRAKTRSAQLWASQHHGLLALSGLAAAGTAWALRRRG